MSLLNRSVLLARLLPALTLCLLSVTLPGQVTFSEVHLDAGGEERGTSLAVVGDRIIVTGHTDAGVADRLAGLVHALDFSGQLTATRRIGGRHRSFARHVTPVDATSFLVGGWYNSNTSFDDFLGYRMDTDLTALQSWRRGRVEEDEEIRRIIPLRGGNYLALGNLSSTNAAYAFVMNREGEVRWQTLIGYPDRNFNFFTDAVELPDGSIFLVGYGIRSGALGGNRLLTARLGASGTLLASNGYRIRGEALRGNRPVILRPDGNLVVFTNYENGRNPANTLILTMTPDGEVISTGALGNPGGGQTIDALLLEDGSYLLTGRATGNDETRGFALILSELGSVLRERTVGTRPGSWVSDVARAPNGGYLFTGSVGCTEAGGDILLAYLDEDLQRPDGCDQRTVAFRPINPPAVERYALGEASRYTDESLPGEPLETILAQARSIGCPSFDLDTDDSSDAPGPADYVHPPLCAAGAFGFLEDDLTVAGIPDSIVVRFPGAGSLLPVGSAVRFRGGAGGELTLFPVSEAEARSALLSLRADDIVPGRVSHAVVFTAHYGCDFELVATAFVTLRASRIASPLRDTVLCPGSELVLDATTPPAATYFWNAIDGSGPDSVGAGARFVVTEPGTYVATLANECASLSDTVTVSGVSGLLGQPVNREEVLCAGDSLKLDLTLPFADRYDWSDGFTGPRRTLGGSGRWSVTIANACDEVRLNVTLATESCCRVYVPTAFSPNGDSVNDTFGAQVDELACDFSDRFELAIYSRWGEEVFVSPDREVRWLGSWREQAAPVGVYTYRLTYFDGVEQIVRAGTVSLLR